MVVPGFLSTDVTVLNNVISNVSSVSWLRSKHWDTPWTDLLNKGDKLNPLSFL